MKYALLLALLFVCVCSQSAAAQVKQWTDEKGVTHFEGGPPPAKQPEPLNIKLRKPQPFQPPSDIRKLRDAAERYLADLGESLTAAHLQLQIVKARGNLAETIYGSRVRFENEQVQGEVYVKLFTPIRSDLLSLEKVLKDRNGGALPQWVKDNRDWRALDAEFAAK
jgi:hypothetical protein